MGNPNPNNSTRFKPGHIKIGGRVKGTPDNKTILRELFDMEEEVMDSSGNIVKLKDGTIVKLPNGLVASIKILEQAKDGDVQSFNAYMDRMEGRPKQVNETEMNFNMRGPLMVEITNQKNKDDTSSED